MPPPILYNVQLLRLFAASAVVFSHAADRIVDRSSVIWMVPWTAGVDAFFVVSGFVMAYVAGDRFGARGAARWFLARRLIRIVPPYWFFTLLLAAIVLLLGGRVDHTTVDAPSLATSLAFLPWPRIDGKLNPILAQGWTLNYEMAFYAAFAITLMRRNGLMLLVIGLAAAAACHFLVPTPWFALRFWTEPVILEFAFGLLLAVVHRLGWRLERRGLAVMLAAAIAFFILAPKGWGPRGTASTAAMIVAAAFILARDPVRIGTVRRWLHYGGDASYTLYLSHMLPVAAIIMVADAVGFSMPWIELACAFAGAVAFGLLFYGWVERPFTVAISRRLGRRPPGEDMEMIDASERTGKTVRSLGQ